MTQYCVLSSQITSVGYVGNIICLKFVQESFKIVEERITSCACVLLKIKSSKTVSSSQVHEQLKK